METSRSEAVNDHREEDEETRNVYLAFCDILGFSAMVIRDFDQTLNIYREFGNSITSADYLRDVEITMYSDSVLITGNDLYRVASAVQVLWFIALSRNFMIRGAITSGRYWEKKTARSLMVASDALIRAVSLESSIGIPAVVIADDIEIDDMAWARFFVDGPFSTPILHFRDRNIVNPFNHFWFASAGNRAENLLEEYPRYKDKYLWFLALHAAVEAGKDLTPEGKLEQLIAAGILGRIDTQGEN